MKKFPDRKYTIEKQLVVKAHYFHKERLKHGDMN